VMFTAQDAQTIHDAFRASKAQLRIFSALCRGRGAPSGRQIYNLSLTRTPTVILGRGARGVVGVGRVKDADARHRLQA